MLCPDIDYEKSDKSLAILWQMNKFPHFVDKEIHDYIHRIFFSSLILLHNSTILQTEY